MPMLATIREVVHEVSPEAHQSLGTRQSSPFASEAELRQHWERAGLVDVETARLATTRLYASFDDLWQPLLSGPTPGSAAVAALPLDARAEIRRRLQERLLSACREASFTLQAEAFAVRGRVGTGASAMAGGAPFPPPDV